MAGSLRVVMQRNSLKLEVWLRKSPYKDAIRFRSSVERVALSQNGTPSIGWQGWDWDGISTLHKRAELSQWLGLSAPTVNSNVGY
ncbi:hypothetical protein E4U48_008323 [Claviceps purpurea]|nr:hypothetical protein E4U48_008323 [Claviceps purpurea]